MSMREYNFIHKQDAKPMKPLTTKLNITLTINGLNQSKDVVLLLIWCLMHLSILILAYFFVN